MGTAFCLPSERRSKPIRFLLLGMSNSGKSTFTKHLRIIYDVSFTVEERVAYKELLLKNIILGIVEISRKVVLKDISEDNRRYVRYFKEMNLSVWDEVGHDAVERARLLWLDPGFQKTWYNCRNLELQFSQLDYLMGNVFRYTDSEYIPTDEDILYSRQRTTGAYTTTFVSEERLFELVDIGGQTPERKKWVSVLGAGINGILYFAGLDEYNIISAENNTTTKMRNSMEVFRQILNDPETFQTTIVLVLNKFDLFEHKILSDEGYQSFLRYFPDFEERCDEDSFWEAAEQDCPNIEASDSDDQRVLVAATYYLIQKFRELNLRKRNLIVLTTCAVKRDIAGSCFTVLSELLCN